MVQFSPDIVQFGDTIGWGTWLDGHYREHQQFIDIGFASTPVVFIPDYDLLSFTWNDRRAVEDWLNVHQTVHEALRNSTGVQGIDLSVVDLENPAYFALWLDTHAQEHAQIRQVLGINF